MGLEFEGPTEGWALRCDGCYSTEFSGAWQSADVLVDDYENYEWSFDEYRDWDGVTFADAHCPDCKPKAVRLVVVANQENIEEEE